MIGSVVALSFLVGFLAGIAVTLREVRRQTRQRDR